MVLLDLSTAFDTIDHDICLGMLQRQMGVSGTAVSWCRSYLRGCKQRMCVGGVSSEDKVLKYGVPQDSVLGLILFTSYTEPLHNALHGVDFMPLT